MFGQLGQVLHQHEVFVNRVSGAITVGLGLVFIGRLQPLQRELRIRRSPSVGLYGAPLVGAAFGLSWTPCLTPTFGTVFFMSQSAGSAGRGAFLTFFYCLGIGIPFVLVACGFGWVASSTALFRRHARWVSASGGGLLVVVGVLLLTGQWGHWMDLLRARIGAGGFAV